MFRFIDALGDGIDQPLIGLIVVITTPKCHFQVTFLLEELFHFRKDTFLQILVSVVEVKDTLIEQSLFQHFIALFQFLLAGHQVMQQFVESGNLTCLHLLFDGVRIAAVALLLMVEDVEHLLERVCLVLMLG